MWIRLRGLCITNHSMSTKMLCALHLSGRTPDVRNTKQASCHSAVARSSSGLTKQSSTQSVANRHFPIGITAGHFCRSYNVEWPATLPRRLQRRYIKRVVFPFPDPKLLILSGLPILSLTFSGLTPHRTECQDASTLACSSHGRPSVQLWSTEATPSRTHRFGTRFDVPPGEPGSASS